MGRDELIDQIVKEGLSITTYGTTGQVEYQIAVNVAKAAVERLQPSGDGENVVEGNTFSDIWNYGVHITKDGERIAPEDFYLSPPPSKAEPSYSDGYAKAIEDAAKVADDLTCSVEYEAENDVKPFYDACETIAAAIRALAGKDEA